MKVTAVETFDLNDMLAELLSVGCYVFHDAELENICENVSWTQEEANFYVGDKPEATDKLQEIVSLRTQGFYELDLVNSLIWKGISHYSDQWHTDDNENLDIQFLCYQTTLAEAEGGALEMQCFDGITRSYYPVMGDVAVINHRDHLLHRVGPLYSSKPRIVCNAAYRYKIQNAD